MPSTNGPSPPMSRRARACWPRCCARPCLQRPPSKETSMLHKPEAAAKIDMADLPVQLAEKPSDAAGARARFFNSGNAFNIKLPVVPGRVFTDAPAKALAASAPTGFVTCDQAAEMECL